MCSALYINALQPNTLAFSLRVLRTSPQWNKKKVQKKAEPLGDYHSTWARTSLLTATDVNAFVPRQQQQPPKIFRLQEEKKSELKTIITRTNATTLKALCKLAKKCWKMVAPEEETDLQRVSWNGFCLLPGWTSRGARTRTLNSRGLLKRKRST